MRWPLIVFISIGIAIAFTDGFAGNCGDANNDGKVNVGDAIYLINYVFKSGPPPNPIQSGDVNSDTRVNVADVVYLINYVFKDGLAPDCISKPILTTAGVSAITQTTAECGGTITSDGGAAITSRGVCWSTNPLPTVADSKTTDGTGIGSFASSLIGLTGNTYYYVRAYATNAIGTEYGTPVLFETLPVVPVVTTAEVSGIKSRTARCGGNITSDGGAAVSDRGVCWSINPSPTVADSKTSDGTGIGSFSSYIDGLTGSTIYYIRGYATNSAGTGYGDQVSFTTLVANTVMDIDGNIYQTEIIGTKVWMTENLKVTHFRNGDAIPFVTDSATWAGLWSEAYCEYNNNVNNVATYGRLYNWFAVADSRNIAPAGWHVPTDEEWKQLEMYLGMSQAEADAEGYRGTTEGGKLKETGTTHWIWPNTGATNESGFYALPAGYRLYNGAYLDMGKSVVFWTSTEENFNWAWYRYLDDYESRIGRRNLDKPCGFSIRCVKD
jgi:uncharacterized protein (TIGR02145 family)